MPLVIQYNGAYAAPKIVCDQCGELITDAKDGNYQWSMVGADEGITTPLYFTHKQCCDAFERTHGDPHAWAAIGLECLPHYLVKNLHTDWRTSQAMARLMAG